MDYDDICSTISVVIATIIVLSVSWFAGFFQWMSGSLLQTVVATVVVFVMILLLTVVFVLILHNLLRKKYKDENDTIMHQFYDKNEEELELRLSIRTSQRTR